MGTALSKKDARRSGGEVSEPDRVNEEAGTPVRRRSAARRRAMPITDGPFAESKEMLGGVWRVRTVFAEEV
jgi:hypothetical protein